MIGAPVASVAFIFHPRYQKMYTSIILIILFNGISYASNAANEFAVDLKEMCEKCDTSTGSGYVNHPKYCHLFVHCSLGPRNTVVGRIKECTRGLLWSQAVKQCVWPLESDCPRNPCTNADPALAFRDLRTCNGYFVCPKDVLEMKCCPANQRYEEDKLACVEDLDCNDPCLPGSANSSGVAPECNRFTVPNNRHKYYWLTGGKNLTMSCALGTAFSQDSCSCTTRTAVIQEKCAPYIYFPFDNTVKDVNEKTASGGSNAWIRKTDPAAIGGGAVYFNGNRQVIAWALNNMEFRSNFTLHFRFKVDVQKTGESERIALIDNSDCDKEATFGVAVLTTSSRTGSVHGGFRLKNGAAVTISSPEISLTTWHEVILLKYGMRAELRVDGKIYPILGALASDIARVDCSMTMGKGTGLVNFVGYLDEVKFYKCVPSEMLK